jgi:hypothetical protein
MVDINLQVDTKQDVAHPWDALVCVPSQKSILCLKLVSSLKVWGTSNTHKYLICLCQASLKPTCLPPSTSSNSDDYKNNNNKTNNNNNNNNNNNRTLYVDLITSFKCWPLLHFMNNRSSDSKLWNYWECMQISSIHFFLCFADRAS